MRKQQGFTLIELLTVVVIIGILAALGITSFSVYRGKAGYSNAEKTLRDARTTLTASIIDVDTVPPSVNLYTQTSPGPIADASAALLLRGMMLPQKVEFQVSHDQSCEDASCQADLLQVKHCLADEHVRWLRFGDGVEVLMQHLPGGGC